MAALDEKLQLGLLDRLKRVISYHFEADTLYIEPGDEEDKEYLQKEPFLHQLELLAQDSINIETVKIK